MRRIGFRNVGFGFVFAAILSIAVLFVSQGSAAKYKAEYKLSTVVGKAFPWGAGAERWADAAPALASGAVDGQENPFRILTGTKLDTAANQKYLTVWGYLADPLNRFPEELSIALVAE